MHFDSDLSFFYNNSSFIAASARYQTRGVDYQKMFRLSGPTRDSKDDLNRINAKAHKKIAPLRLEAPPSLKDAGVTIRARFPQADRRQLIVFAYYGKSCDLRIKFDLVKGVAIVSTREKSSIAFSRRDLPSSLRNLPMCRGIDVRLNVSCLLLCGFESAVIQCQCLFIVSTFRSYFIFCFMARFYEHSVNLPWVWECFVKVAVADFVFVIMRKCFSGCEVLNNVIEKSATLEKFCLRRLRNN